MSRVCQEKEQCLYCDEYSAEQQSSLPFTGLVNGKEVEYAAPGWKCNVCGQIWTTAEDAVEHDRIKAENYRVGGSLMTASEMEAKRAKLGMSKTEFCDLLHISRMNYDRWLKGLVQSDAMDQAIRAKIDENVAAMNYLRLLWSSYAKKPPNFRGNATPQVEKVFQLILEFLRRKDDEDVGKLYLNKLCWYADQLFYNTQGCSISGSPYLALQWGPVIPSYDQIFSAMLWAGYIKESGENNYVAATSATLVNLTDSEMKAVDYVWQSFRYRLGQLAAKSHREEGWQKTPALSDVSFLLSVPLKNIDEEKFRRECGF